MSIALTSKVASWLRIGAEVDLPAEFDNEAQVYMLRILGRIPLIENRNNVYIQGSFSIGSLSDLNAFTGAGAAIGYGRKINSSWEFGGRIGLQAANLSYDLNGDLYTSGSFLYNRLTVYGSYIF